MVIIDANHVDIFSKKIMQFGLQPASDIDSEPKKTPSPKELVLQRNIRSFASCFLQEMVLTVPNLPTEEEYGKLQKEHKLRLKREIEREREAAQLAAQRVSQCRCQERGGGNFKLVHDSIKPPVWSRRFVAKFV